MQKLMGANEYLSSAESTAWFFADVDTFHGASNFLLEKFNPLPQVIYKSRVVKQAIAMLSLN